MSRSKKLDIRQDNISNTLIFRQQSLINYASENGFVTRSALAERDGNRVRIRFTCSTEKNTYHSMNITIRLNMILAYEITSEQLPKLVQEKV